MVKSITYTDEILEEVAEELGLTTKEVSDVYEQMINYIDYKVNFSDVCSIQVPHIGTMYINALSATKRIKKLKEAKPTEKNILRLEAWKKKRKAIKETSDKFRKVARVPNRMSSILTRLRREYYTKTGKNADWETLEDMQNK